MALAEWLEPPFAAGHDPKELGASLQFLAQSQARMTLINLEDLLLETAPQNVPGTVDASNWTKKLKRPLAKLQIPEDLLANLPRR